MSTTLTTLRSEAKSLKRELRRVTDALPTTVPLWDRSGKPVHPKLLRLHEIERRLLQIERQVLRIVLK